MEVVDEVMDDAEDDINDADEEADNDEDMDEEEKEKLKKELSEMKESMDKMKEDVAKLKEAAKPGVLRSILDFVGKTVATGAIFFMVNTAMAKLMALNKNGKDDKNKTNQSKLEKIKAFMSLYKDLNNLSKVLQTWFVAHQSEQVTLSGIDVPLVDIFNKYTKDMADKMDAIFKIMNSLRTKDADGKSTTSIPTSAQVGNLVTGFQAYAAILPKLLTFAKEEAAKYPTVKSFPLQQSDIDTINSDLETAKNLPYPE